MRNRRGFTLIEMMIVVAILGILASIAVPNFLDMQLRAKRAEVPANVDGIKTAELAYEAAYDELVAQTAFIPSESVGKSPVDWVDGTNFNSLGWSPDGAVRGAYKVDVDEDEFVAFGISDVDGDGTRATYTANRLVNVTAITGSLTY